MKTFGYAGGLLTLLGTASLAHADLSANGEMGLPLNPTAQEPALGTVQLQGSFQKWGDLTLFGLPVSTVKTYDFHAAAQVVPHVEVNLGIDKLSATDPFGFGINALGRTSGSFGVKFQLTQARRGHGIDTAVGIGENRALFQTQFGYFAASLPYRFRHGHAAPLWLHAGLRYDHFSANDIGGPNSNKWSFYGGVEVPLLRRGELSFVGEAGGKNNDLGFQSIPYSYGLRLASPRKNLWGKFGYMRQGITGNSGIYVQVGCALGKRR